MGKIESEAKRIDDLLEAELEYNLVVDPVLVSHLLAQIILAKRFDETLLEAESPYEDLCEYKHQIEDPELRELKEQLESNPELYRFIYPFEKQILSLVSSYFSDELSYCGLGCVHEDDDRMCYFCGVIHDRIIGKFDEQKFRVCCRCKQKLVSFMESKPTIIVGSPPCGDLSDEGPSEEITVEKQVEKEEKQSVEKQEGPLLN